MKQPSYWAAAFAAIALPALFGWPLAQRGRVHLSGTSTVTICRRKSSTPNICCTRSCPFWNDRAGQGYPIVGESQTGDFYPLNAPLLSAVGHQFGLQRQPPAARRARICFHLAVCARDRVEPLVLWSDRGLVFVYAWFPSRCCWEWAIVGGAWMPAAFWCVEQFLNTLRSGFVWCGGGPHPSDCWREHLLWSVLDDSRAGSVCRASSPFCRTKCAAGVDSSACRA